MSARRAIAIVACCAGAIGGGSSLAHAAPSTAWYVVRLSTDGKRALMLDLSDSSSHQHFRVVTIDTGAIETELDLPVLSSLPLETLNDSGGVNTNKIDVLAPGLSAELVHAGAVLASLPLGAGGRIAASPDGHHVAFNGGDWIYTAVDGKIITRLSAEASYDPWFTPDGKSLIFRREHGTFDGIDGKYELYTTSVDGLQAPHELAGTAGVRGDVALTDHDAIRVLTAADSIKTCVVEVNLRAPIRAKQVACLPDRERVESCVFSPTGKYLGCETMRELPELDPNSVRIEHGKRIPMHKLAFRIRALELATGKVTTDVGGLGSVSAVSDDGRLVLNGNDSLFVIDRDGAQHRIAGTVGLFTYFRAPSEAHELVTEHDGALTVIDPAKP